MCLWRVSDELQDELCFPAAIFLGRLTHAVPGCKPLGISHTEMKPGFQLGVGDRSQVEPFRAEPSEGRADRINVCLRACGSFGLGLRTQKGKRGQYSLLATAY